jgi:hypothetical protein
MASSPEKKAKWVSDSVHGALLFILFMDSIHNPDSHSSSEIYRDERLPFRIYSGKKFKTYCQTAANRAIRFKGNGTGLSPKFRELLKRARIDYADLLATLKEHASFQDNNEDEDYKNSDAEDILLNEEIEDLPLSRQIQNLNLTPARKTRASGSCSCEPVISVTRRPMSTVH